MCNACVCLPRRQNRYCCEIFTRANTTEEHENVERINRNANNTFPMDCGVKIC